MTQPLSFPFFLLLLQGGEVVQETITSNINDDIIILEFQRTDGTLITQLIDFRNVSIKYVQYYLVFIVKIAIYIIRGNM